MEIMLKTSTSIIQSPKKFNISDPDFGEHTIPLSELESKEEYERVSVKVKVIATTDPVMQEVLVADATSTAKCTLWEARVCSLKHGTCYQFYVREFGSKKFLAVAKDVPKWKSLTI